MRIFKKLIPVFILLLLAFYSFTQYEQLPRVVLNAVIFLPVLLALAVLGLSVHFNRSPVFFYLLIIASVSILLGLELVQHDLIYALTGFFVPIILLAITLLPERGIFSLRAIPAYFILSGVVIFSLVVVFTEPAIISQLLLQDWFPERYFDWTPLSQSVLAAGIISFLGLLVLSFLRRATHVSAGLGILIILMVQLHAGATSASLTVFTSFALLLCLYAVMQESWRMAYLDELTELPARRALREKFQKIAGAYSIAMIDIDHFKKFNDTYGHDTGDAVLRMIAAKLNQVTGSGSAYRYGGEEFTIVFAGKTAEQAFTHLDNIREKIAASPFVINREGRRKSDRHGGRADRKSVQVTVSMGVTDSTAGMSSPWDIMKEADKALYRAKKKGRNQVCI